MGQPQEIWFVHPKAYDELFPQRINEIRLKPDSVYTAVFDLKDHDEFCIGFNAKLHTIGRIATGDMQLDFSALDIDLHPQGPPITANIADGYMNRNGMEPRHWSATHVPSGEFRKKELGSGFFIDYTDEIEPSILIAISESDEQPLYA